MTVTLPVRSDVARYAFTVDLQGASYTFTFRWNTREGAWYFDLSDAAGDLIVAGKKIVVDWPLLANVIDARRPRGELMAVDTTGEGEPGQADLGGRVQLIYVEAGG